MKPTRRPSRTPLSPAGKSWRWLVAGVLGCVAVEMFAANGPPASLLLATIRAGFLAPARLAVSEASELFVADPVARSVFVLDVFGRESSRHNFPGKPLAIALGADGEIYLGDAAIGAVSVFDAQWNLLRQLGQGAGEFQLPGHIALSTRGGITTVFVADGLAHQIKAYREGLLIGQYGSRGAGPQQFDFPAGLWVSPERIVFAVDQNNDRVQVLDENGNFLRWFSLDPTLSGLSNAGRAQGIAGDRDGRLYVADTFQGIIKVFDVSGAYLGRLSLHGRSAGELRSPGGLAVDPYGRLWVADANNSCVDGFGLDCFMHLAVNPAVPMVAAGAPVSFTVTSGCGAPAGFQWFKDGVALVDGGRVSGATQATLSLANAALADAGLYSAVITQANFTLASPDAPLSVVSAPVITANPTSRSVTRSGSVAFSVSASGGGLAYQWLRNGAELAGGTQSLLSITNVQSYEAGSYSARVSNIAGTATSLAATLTVLVPPTIEIAPTNLIAAVNSTVSWSVSAVGASPLTYQWYRNNISLSGQTRTALVLSNVTAAVNGTYLVRVANSAGAATASFKFAVDVPVTLTNSRGVNRELVFAWNNPFFVLQSAPDWNGPWQLLSQTSPYTVTAAAMATNPAQYFRLMRQ